MKDVNYLNDIMLKIPIYADNAATTPMDPEAKEIMVSLLSDYANPSQPYIMSRNVKKTLSDARDIIANCIGAKPEEIIFTSGGSESDNYAIKGVIPTHNHERIITSTFEHHAVLKPCEQLAKSGRPVTYISPNAYGCIESKSLFSKLSDDVGIVSIMSANNELGTIQPIKSLVEITHKAGAVFHTDAVQAVGHVKIDVNQTKVDLLSASAHKFNGPKGIGFLFVRSGVALEPLIAGGSQQFGLRAGTENVPAIASMAVALLNNCRNIDANKIKLREMEKVFLHHLDESGLQYYHNCFESEHLPGLISLSFRGMSGESILHRLDLMGISVSTGSACNSEMTEISHVLKSINLPIELSKGTIRVSFGKYNTVDDAIHVAEAIIKICKI